MITKDSIEKLRLDAERIHRRIDRLERAIMGDETVNDDPIYPSIKMVAEETMRFYPNVTLGDLKSSRRHRYVTMVRHIAIHLAKKVTLASFPMLGRFFGGRDHSTVMSADEKITSLRKSDAELDRQLLHIEKTIEHRMKQENCARYSHAA